jgi:hypothetical protein
MSKHGLPGRVGPAGTFRMACPCLRGWLPIVERRGYGATLPAFPLGCLLRLAVKRRSLQEIFTIPSSGLFSKRFGCSARCIMHSMYSERTDCRFQHSQQGEVNFQKQQISPDYS